VCRHVGWLGSPRTVASLVLDPPHGLLVQSYAPRRQAHGRLNADGWGVGFYADGRTEPARWRSARPLWSDGSFASLAPLLSSSCMVAAVRSATPGMPVEEAATAPFTDGTWLLSHNGRVDRSVLPWEPSAESVCDSALLAAHVFARRAQAVTDVVAEVVGNVVREVSGRDPAARLNLLLADGGRLLATTWGDTLSYLVDDTGVVVASEPYDDDPRWVDVPDRCLVEVGPDGLTVNPLEPS
jgi:gamma-glutamyl hercynylcysteine S-oxide hydrolase